MSPTMDFFAHQERARNRTVQLVFMFALAVVTIIAAIYAGLLIGLSTAEVEFAREYGFWNAELFLATAAVVSLIVLAGTLYKVNALSGPGGGIRVATMLGGTQVNSQTRDPDERKLLNVVEEMAIAAGTPVPPVFVLDEDAINAFAAGYVPSDAVVAVTRGAMRALTREELQGVIAHEFSHILNGDMKLNIRLVAVLNGIVLLALIGSTILRAMGRPRRSSSKSSGKGGGAIVLAILLVAITFMVVGYIGEFFARMIQMAVSRQREFLADASAVQFTRNPAGIAGALRKIGGLSEKSYLGNANAKAVSHLFFADGLKRSFATFFSTHPDLTTRIQRIDPSWSGEYEKVRLPERSATSEGTSSFAGASAPAPARSRPAPKDAAVFEVRMSPEKVIESVGSVGPEQVAAASELITSLPDTLVAASREPFGARAVVFALLLDRDGQVCGAQIARIQQHADAPVLAELQRVMPEALTLEPQQRLPLLELCLPALRQLSDTQWVAFVDTVEYLIQADSRIDIFEAAMRILVLRQYRLASGKAQTSVEYRSLSKVVPETVTLLSILAWFGTGQDAAKASAAFTAGAQRLASRTIPLQPLAFASLTIDKLQPALDTLSRSSPAVKRWIIDACVACIAADGVVAIPEAELLRAVGSALDIPIPPFSPTATAS